MLTAVLLGTAAALCWSVGNVLAAVALRDVRTSTATLVSMLASLAVVIPLALVLDPNGLVSISAVGIAWFVALGLANFPAGRYATYAAIGRIGASRAILVRNATPVIIVIVGMIVFAERPGVAVLLGGAMIVLGLYLVVGDRPGQNGTATSTRPRRIVLIGYFFALLAAVSYAIGSLLMHATVFTYGSVWVAGAISVLAGTVVIAAMDAPTFEVAAVRRVRPTLFMIGTGILSSIAVLLAYAAYGIGPVSVVAPFVNLQPLFTPLIAHLALGGVERITRRLLLSLLLATAGALVIVGTVG